MNSVSVRVNKALLLSYHKMAAWNFADLCKFLQMIFIQMLVFVLSPVLGPFNARRS